jgi:hypothetical protein
MTSPVFTPAFDAEVRLAVASVDRRKKAELTEGDLETLARGVEVGRVGDVAFSIACAAKGLLIHYFLQQHERIHGARAKELAAEFDRFLATLKLDTAYDEQIKARPLSEEDLLCVVHVAGNPDISRALFERVRKSSSKFIGSLAELSKSNLNAEGVLRISDKMNTSPPLDETDSAIAIVKLAANKVAAEKVSADQPVKNIFQMVELFLDNEGFVALKDCFEVEQTFSRDGTTVFLCKFTKAKTAGAAPRAKGLRENLLPGAGHEFETEMALLMMSENRVFLHHRELDDRDGGNGFLINLDELKRSVAAVDLRPYRAPTLAPTPVTAPEVSAAAHPPSLVTTSGVARK